MIPVSKQKLVGDTTAMVKEFEQQYLDGLITQGEKYNKVSTPGRTAPTGWPTP